MGKSGLGKEDYGGIQGEFRESLKGKMRGNGGSTCKRTEKENEEFVVI